jgi:hypothetical protein
MLTIPASSTIAGSAPSGASEVTCTLNLMELNDSTQAETYTTDQQQLALSAATIYTATADGPTLVRSIHVVNTDAANVSTFQLFVGGTAAANAITPVFTLPAGGSATYEDSEGWTFLDNLGKVKSTGGFSSTFVQRFIIAGAATYIPSVGMKACIAIVTGGGGGGGGADTSAGGSADVGVASGGGAGGTAIGWFTAAQVGTSVSLNVGSAGTAGSGTNGTSGGAGGNSTWASTTLVGTGGGAGTGSGVTTQDSQAIAGGAGGVPTGGTLNVTGGAGSPGYAGSIDGTLDLVMANSGRGGVSFWGGGGRSNAGAQASLTTDLTAAGAAGLAYGSGGAGGYDLTTATGVAGGAGMTGVIVVVEFIG